MPSPIGHALAGIAIAGASGGSKRPPISHISVLAFCAAAPDLDLLLGFFGGVNQHRGASHSVGAAVLAGGMAFFLRRLGFDLPRAWAVGAAWGSHVLLDFLGLDTSPPSGEMALWPLSTSYFISPIPFFYDVRRTFSVSAIGHNTIAVVIELTVLIPIVMMFWRGAFRPRSG